jgi:glycosyltransferase involved in cell wall biosynthesis
MVTASVIRPTPFELLTWPTSEPMTAETKRALKVLVLDEEIPYPPDSGKRIRTWNLLKRLAQNHRVHLLCYGRAEDPSCAALASAGVVLHLVEPAKPLAGFALYRRLFANLFSPYPFSVVKHYSRRFQKTLDGLVKGEDWDVVQCEWTPYARFLVRVAVPTLITSHNVESQIWRRRAERSAGIVERIFFRMQEWKMAWFERRALGRAKAVTAVTEADAATMRGWGVQQVTVVPNGVDPEFYSSAIEPESANEILSVASLDWFPNAQAVDYFTREILPSLRALKPELVFKVVGRRAPDWLQEKLRKLPGVDFVGEVDDVRPHLDRAAVVVVPLRIGGGSRLKILEALAAGKAVVSTSIGAEGLDLEPGRHLLVADSPQEFVERVVELLDSPAERRRLGDNGKKLAGERYGWDGIAKGLEHVWLNYSRRPCRSVSQRTRILHLRATDFVGGPEKQILHHAVDIREFGFDVWVGSFRDQQKPLEILQVAKERGLPIFESQRAGRFDPRAIFEVASFLKREKIQLLCTHGFKANVIGALAKKFAGVPQIAFCRGWTAETLSVRVYEFLERRFLALADRIICVSEAQAEYFTSRHFLQPRISVVHNAMLDSVDTDLECDRGASKTRLGFSPATRLVGVVGRLSVEKGQRFLVEAASELANEFSDLKIVLLGEGRERVNLEHQIAKLGLENVVVLEGFQKNVAVWMQAFDVLANCSLTEGIPNAILEAMAVGTPVVATAVGGVPELIKDRETGLLIAPGNSAALATGVAKLLSDPVLALRLGQAGRAWVQERFSARGQRNLLLSIYRESLGLSNVPAEAQSGGPAPDPARAQNDAWIEPVSSKPADLPFLSVVVPVRNEEAHIVAVLAQLQEQDYPPNRFEVLVAVGTSTDGTAEIVEEFRLHTSMTVRLFANPALLSSTGRNIGAKNAFGEYVLFIDGHCRIPSKTLLRDAAELFETKKADCLCRPQPLTMEGNNLFQNVVAHARATPLGHGRDSMIFATEHEGPVNPTSAGAMYRRTVFDRIGYFDESFDACEDVEFNHRVLSAGLLSYVSPRLAVLYQPRNSARLLGRQMMRYGQGRFRLVQKHHKAFSISQLFPAGLLLWLVFGAIGSTLSWPFAILFTASLAFYAMIVLYFSALLGLRYGLAHFWRGPIVYLTIHLGLGAGFLREALRFGRSGKHPGAKVSSSPAGKPRSWEPPSSVKT